MVSPFRVSLTTPMIEKFCALNVKHNNRKYSTANLFKASKDSQKESRLLPLRFIGKSSQTIKQQLLSEPFEGIPVLLQMSFIHQLCGQYIKVHAIEVAAAHHQ